MPSPSVKFQNRLYFVFDHFGIHAGNMNELSGVDLPMSALKNNRIAFPERISYIWDQPLFYVQKVYFMNCAVSPCSDQALILERGITGGDI
jgi:hypothetical protein